MKVLIVKTSSMGDAIHTFPAVEDARRARPDVTFDWCVEEMFAPIVALHPAIRKIHTVAIRRWRTKLFDAGTWRETREFRKTVRASGYDLVIDAQGLLKSALVARQAGAPIVGQDWATAREPVAALFYQRPFAIPRDLHAIERSRRLFGLALGYQPDLSQLSSGLARLPDHSGKSAFLLHGTSREDKKWPVAEWIETARLLVSKGFTPLTTYSNQREQAVAEAIFAAVPETGLIPKLPLADIAGRIAASSMVIGTDTGLTHLASAYGLPTVGIFLTTPPGLAGPLGPFSTTLDAQQNGGRVTPAAAVAEGEKMLALQKLR